MKKINLILLGFIGLIRNVFAHTGDDDYGHHMMGGMMHGNYGSGVMAFGWFIWILVVIILVLLIMWFLKQLQK